MQSHSLGVVILPFDLSEASEEVKRSYLLSILSPWKPFKMRKNLTNIRCACRKKQFFNMNQDNTTLHARLTSHPISAVMIT